MRCTRVHQHHPEGAVLHLQAAALQPEKCTEELDGSVQGTEHARRYMRQFCPFLG